MSSFRTFTPREVEARIAAGDTLVIFRGHVLRLNKWQDVNPNHFVATVPLRSTQCADPVPKRNRLVESRMYHQANKTQNRSHSLETLESMKKYVLLNIEFVSIY